MIHANLNKGLVAVVIATLFIFMGGCVSEEEEDESDGQLTAPVATKVIYAQVDPAMDEGGIAAIFSDVEKKGSIAIEVLGDGNGAIDRINRYYLVNHETGISVSMKLDENGLPVSITYPDGNELQFTNLTSKSVDISVFDSAGLLIAGPVSYEDDLSEIINASSSVSTRSLNAPRKVNWARICVDYPCDQMYYAASKTLDLLGCYGATGAAAATGGLTIPFATAVCGSVIISVASDLAKAATGSGLFDATGLLSGGLSTGGACIYSLIKHDEAVGCVKGLYELTAWVYEKADTGSQANNINALFPNDCLTGSWTGTMSCGGAGQPATSLPAAVNMIQDGYFMSFPNQDSQIAPNGVEINLPSVKKMSDGKSLILSGSVTQQEQGVSIKTTITQSYNFQSCSSVFSNSDMRFESNQNGSPNVTVKCTGTLTK